MNTNMSDFRLW